MKIQSVLRGVSLMVHVPATMGVLSLPVALAFDEPEGAQAFLITAAAGLLIGQAGYWAFRKQKKNNLHLSELMWAASLGWVFVIMIGTIPFLYLSTVYSPAQVEGYALQPFQHISNAIFESTSGFTSAGLSMVVKNASELPKSLQWWRSFMQWVGGVGIIVFITTYANQTLDTVQGKFSQHYDTQTVPSVNLNIQKVGWIYLLFTLLCCGVLFVQGVPFWEAVNHGMTGVATGGFTITDNSLYTYEASLLGTIIPFMIIGALNFSLYHQLFTQFAVKNFFTNRQHIAFILLLLSGVGLLHVFQSRNVSSWLSEGFQFVSALSTCGFQSQSLHNWGDGSLLMLTLAMLIGGVTNSTAGGIKIFRLLMFIKASIQNITMIVSQPHQFTAQGSDEDKKFRIVAIFCFGWVIVYLTGVFVMWYHIHPQYPLSSIMFENASAISTVGLSTGITSADVPLTVKGILILEMWVGRLELIPLFLPIAEIVQRSPLKTK